MQYVTGITNQPSQVFNLTADDGSTITLSIAYRPQQMGWFYNLTWNGTTPVTQINGRRITTVPNLLRQFRNLLTFGLSCVTTDNYEPLGINAFFSSYAQLVLLSAADVAQIESTVFPGTS